MYRLGVVVPFCVTTPWFGKGGRPHQVHYSTMKNLKPARWDKILRVFLTPPKKCTLYPKYTWSPPWKKSKTLMKPRYGNPSRYMIKYCRVSCAPPPQKKNLYYTPNIPDLSPKSKNLYEAVIWCDVTRSFCAPLLYVELSAPKKEKISKKLWRGTAVYKWFTWITCNLNTL